jgi:hypothetical protein
LQLAVACARAETVVAAWVSRAGRDTVEAVGKRCAQVRGTRDERLVMTPDPRDLARGLDARERAILLAIYGHKVLVTEHLKAMFFGSLRRAQDRLRCPCPRQDSNLRHPL